MASNRRVVWLGLALLLAGCQSRLNVDKNYRLDPGQIQTFEFDGPRYEQRVVVNVEADAPVSVCIFLNKDADAVEKDLMAGKDKAAKALAFWKGDDKGTLEATAPAKEIVGVRIEAGTKAATVTIHVVGK